MHNLNALRLGVGAIWIVSIASLCAQEQKQPAAASSTMKTFLEETLRRYLKRPGLEDDQSTRYLYAFVDLNNDGTQEAIVYVTGQRWCGSGGCPTLILSRSGPSYK